MTTIAYKFEDPNDVYTFIRNSLVNDPYCTREYSILAPSSIVAQCYAMIKADMIGMLPNHIMQPYQLGVISTNFNPHNYVTKIIRDWEDDVIEIKGICGIYFHSQAFYKESWDCTTVLAYCKSDKLPHINGGIGQIIPSSCKISQYLWNNEPLYVGIYIGDTSFYEDDYCMTISKRKRTEFRYECMTAISNCGKCGKSFKSNIVAEFDNIYYHIPCTVNTAKIISRIYPELQHEPIYKKIIEELRDYHEFRGHQGQVVPLKSFVLVSEVEEYNYYMTNYNTVDNRKLVIYVCSKKVINDNGRYLSLAKWVR